LHRPPRSFGGGAWGLFPAAREAGMRFAAHARDSNTGSMTVGPGPGSFVVRALEALRGELRSRTRLSNRPHAPPKAWRRFESRPAA